MRPDKNKPKRRFSWSTEEGRALIYQVVAVAILALVAWFMLSNTARNLATMQIRSGFGFLSQPAGFDIGEGLVAYASSDSYLRAFLVGVSNTVRVALAGIVLATVLGTLVGIGRLSRNFLLRKLCDGFVETLRNIPLLIQLLGWYLVITELLPTAHEAIQLLPHTYLSKSGLQLPMPVWSPGWLLALIGLPVGIVCARLIRKSAQRKRDRTGDAPRIAVPMAAVIVGMPILGWLAGGAPTAFDLPEATVFSISGGMALTPEFLALLAGLTLYTASSIAEIVRAGILAVSSGQLEASSALGLSRRQTLRLVVLPQAMRVIVPPLTSQYLNLTKNSSLAVTVGYPDIVSVANTSLNQNGQALECISLIMLVYLTISLLIAAFMNWYNHRMALVER
ncbi:amino acid ABC transporter permease [Pollutimonas sp. M17]|uniref:amino acid ABC transporter permease n=1 Tax=Pollutimonas sp. M17 TaxID=2962065 RepID=UPI0021F3E243|nr:ABC transporter permease subunit [Pollutimonas sp. M17]UYO95269.1 ABC transporter permease subunit [Pollutimonas sp. M17]HWK71471.1 ABC transporter permease subunit [Burkholderiaceae bacterium]